MEKMELERGIRLERKFELTSRFGQKPKLSNFIGGSVLMVQEDFNCFISSADVIAVEGSITDCNDNQKACTSFFNSVRSNPTVENIQFSLLILS